MEWFADTWFYVALLDRRDAHHSRATRIVNAMAGVSIVTHDGVFTELLTHFAEDGAQARLRVAGQVRDSMRDGVVIPANRELFLLGLDLYASRPDKEWSHVDCMSMVLMEQRGIRHVLTNDHHFAQAGFTLVNQ
jgi:uncharacterized protein